MTIKLKQNADYTSLYIKLSGSILQSWKKYSKENNTTMSSVAIYAVEQEYSNLFENDKKEELFVISQTGEKKNTTITIPVDLHNKLKTLANNHKVTMLSLVENAVIRLIRKNKLY